MDDEEPEELEDSLVFPDDSLAFSDDSLAFSDDGEVSGDVSVGPFSNIYK